jgi:hypothetical protein
VFGLGTDWRRFAARTPGADQLIFAVGGPPAKVTAWIQATVDATPKAGTAVPITDTAPTTDPFNLLLVAIQLPGKKDRADAVDRLLYGLRKQRLGRDGGCCPHVRHLRGDVVSLRIW